ISKNNFRPPPKVESALVRIEPRRPPPPINFIEWDGMIRIITERRNRILQKIFSNKNVIETLHKNHVTYCQLKNIVMFFAFSFIISNYISIQSEKKKICSGFGDTITIVIAN